MASFVINELKQVGIEATLKQIETAQWHAMATRGEYQIGANLTGIGLDDPDANYYENFACGSPRNYSELLQRGGHEDDRAAVAGARRQEAAGRWCWTSRRSSRTTRRGRPCWLAARLLHGVAAREEPDPAPVDVYNFGRMQEVWLDK